MDRFNGIIVSAIDSCNSNTLQSDADSNPISISSSSSSSSTLIYIPLPNTNSKRSMTALKIPASASMDKGLSTMCSVRGNLTSSSAAAFITAGTEKVVNLWELNEDLMVNRVTEVHRSHTAAIYDVVQSGANDNILWSGGADTRLVGWCMDAQRPIFSQKMSNRISHLLTNTSAHPYSLMTVYTSTEAQLQILDTRIPNHPPTHIFGHREISPTSRYMRPAWSPCGNYVAFGTAVPESKLSAIHLWDLRSPSHPKSPPLKSYSFPIERRFINCEFNLAGNVLVATSSTDNVMTFLDFNK